MRKLGVPTAFFGVVALLATGSVTAWAEGDNESCLACHGNPTITGKKIEKPYIDAVQFERTSHAGVGCTSCHTNVPENHSEGIGKVTQTSCQDCHAEIQATYEKTTHAANASCGDCHNPHTVKPPSAVSGADIIGQCSKCHDSAQIGATHGKWLPQASLHLKSVPCLSCHIDSKEFVVTLFMGKRDSSKSDFALLTNYELGRVLPEGVSAPQWIDSDKDGTISLNELRDFNLSKRPKEIRLLGMMMPEKVDHNFQLMLNRRDCSFCHASGTNARQTSFVAIPERDGSYSRVPVEKGAVMDALFGTPDFYMVGSTRSPLLSWIGLAIIIAGGMFPLVHGTFRYLTRKNRRNGSH